MGVSKMENKPFYQKIWFFATVAAIAIVAIVMFVILGNTNSKPAETAASDKNASAKSSTAVSAPTRKPSPNAGDNPWTFKNDVFDAGNLTYVLKGSEIVDGPESSKIMIIRMDATNNNSEKEMVPGTVAMVMEAHQNDTSLNFGFPTLTGDLKEEVAAFNQPLASGKTAPVAVAYKLSNEDDVKLIFQDSDFSKLGEKVYPVK